MKKRTPQKLSSSTARRIATLGIAGGATALAGGTADAGINYFDLDPDGSVVSSTFTLDVDGPFGGDLTPELQFTHVFPGAGTNYFGNATAQAASASAFVGGFFGAGSAYRYVSNPTSGAALANLNIAGTQLAADPARNFGVISNGQIGRMAFANSTGTQDFQFMDGNTGFVTFQFQDNVAGKVAFGWAKVTVSEAAGGFSDKNTITIHDFAWSSDTAIAMGQVPEPSAIGLLALGAAGIGMMRRRPKSPDSAAALT